MKETYHNIKFSSALANRAVYGGVYTSDLVMISLVAFIVTIILDGYDIVFVYGVIAAICIPLYIFLLIKNRFLPKGWLLFGLRSLLGGRQESMTFKKQEAKWDF